LNLESSGYPLFFSGQVAPQITEGGKRMGKYASWAEYEENVPKVYEEKATKEAFLKGLEGIALAGMEPKPERGDHYEVGVDGKGDDVVTGFKRAMAGGRWIWRRPCAPRTK
jgi:hypothetical protein